MTEDFQNIFTFSVSIRDVLANIIVALICGVLISVLYRYTYKGLSYSATFANSIIMLTMITAIVIMVIGNNLARAFGLVGAMSIIRFRTAVKGSQDIMFIFFALAIGLASGVSLYAVALVSTVFIGLVILVITKMGISQTKKRDFLLQIVSDPAHGEDSPYTMILKKFCRRYKLVNVKAIGDEEQSALELSYYVALRNEDRSENFISALKKIEGTQQINLFFDEE
jgi:uncharacterized membrane protein YhiD involved in acid resistance